MLRGYTCRASRFVQVFWEITPIPVSHALVRDAGSGSPWQPLDSCRYGAITPI
jgi:hypothetical protein